MSNRLPESRTMERLTNPSIFKRIGYLKCLILGAARSRCSAIDPGFRVGFDPPAARFYQRFGLEEQLPVLRKPTGANTLREANTLSAGEGKRAEK